MRNPLSSLHPALAFFYFAGIFVVSVFVLHPAFLGISVTAALLYLALLKGAKKALLRLLAFLPMALLIALFNPLFNHEGATILWYLKSQNPVTLESVLYGAASGMMFLCVLLWFSCYHEVMTSDKFIALFGRILPSASLLLSMTLRFVPRYRVQLGLLMRGQKAVGKDPGQGSLCCRVKKARGLLSIMTTWALESAVETADSMKARGYGLEGRTSFSVFSFKRKDRWAASALVLLFFGAAGGIVLGLVSVRYFPTFRASPRSAGGTLATLAWLLFCLFPVVTGLWEEVTWRYSKSKI